MHVYGCRCTWSPCLLPGASGAAAETCAVWVRVCVYGCKRWRWPGGFWLGAASWVLFRLQSEQAEANCASLARGGLACHGAGHWFEQESKLVPPRRYSVVVITSDSESVDSSSNLGSNSSFSSVLLRDGALWASRERGRVHQLHMLPAACNQVMIVWSPTRPHAVLCCAVQGLGLGRPGPGQRSGGRGGTRDTDSQLVSYVSSCLVSLPSL